MGKKVICSIGLGGSITAEVSGVNGPSCKDDLSWLDKIGLIESENPTVDFDRDPELDTDQDVNQTN